MYEGVNHVWQTEIRVRTVETLMPQPSVLEVEMVIKKLKM